MMSRYVVVEFDDHHGCMEFKQMVGELVRCKECIHYKTSISCVGGKYDGCDQWLDNGNEIEVKADDFCSYGERDKDTNVPNKRQTERSE